MMKSFFKKLSLVMALAMVVTLAAPAAQAFAADLIIAGQEEAKADAKESYSVEVGGEPIDFKFYGAAAGWQDLYKWESSDETIAKPLVNEKGEQDGRFEALKDGEVEVILTIGEQKATVKLVVGEGVVVDNKAFEVKQTTANTVEITFADAKYATKDITVTKLGKTTTGDVTEIVWPINTATVKDNVATVTTWMDFGTGDYRFTANGESVDKLMKVGLPAFAVITYKDTYPFKENAIKPTATVYDEAGVKLTGYNDWYYELLNADADAYLESDGSLYLWNVGARAQIKATLTYFVGTEAKTLECPVDVTCVAEPAYTVNNYIEKYAITEETDFSKVAWGKTDVIIGNEKDYYVAGVIKDSLNKENSITALNGYYVRYQSSNPSVAIVDEVYGQVLGVNTGNAYVLVSLYKENGDTDIAMGVIAAIPVNVVAAKKASAVTLDKTVATLLTKGDFTDVTVTATTKNQYGGDYADSIKSVYAKVNEKTYSDQTYYEKVVKNEETGEDETVKVYYVTLSGSKFTIDAANFADEKVNKLTFTVEMNSGLKTTFVLNIKAVDDVDKLNKTYALNVNGANIALKDGKLALNDLTAGIEVVSAWAGNNLQVSEFYWGKPADSVIAAGDLYVIITGPDGKDLKADSATHASLTFNAITSDTATSAALTTMATGKYVVKLYRVTQRVQSGDKVIVQTTVCDTEVFEIKNSLPGVTDFDVTSNKYTDAANVINKDNVTLKWNGTEWKETGLTVLSINASEELNNSVYVYGFTVKVPYGEAYYTVYVPVNELFTK